MTRLDGHSALGYSAMVDMFWMRRILAKEKQPTIEKYNEKSTDTVKVMSESKLADGVTSKCGLSMIKWVNISKLLLADHTKTATWYTESRQELGFIYTATDALGSDWLLQTTVTFPRPTHYFTCIRAAPGSPELRVTDGRFGGTCPNIR